MKALYDQFLRAHRFIGIMIAKPRYDQFVSAHRFIGGINIRQAIMPHKLPMFIGKGLLTVMFFLILNILPNAKQMPFADRKCAVTRLPGKPLQGQALLIEEMRTAPFYLPYYIGDSNFWIEQKKQVNMVSYATNTVDIATSCNDLLTQLIMDDSSDTRQNNRLAVLGSKYGVNPNFRIRMAHERGGLFLDGQLMEKIAIRQIDWLTNPVFPPINRWADTN